VQYILSPAHNRLDDFDSEFHEISPRLTERRICKNRSVGIALCAADPFALFLGMELLVM
jgi:hypothetical protein